MTQFDATKAAATIVSHWRAGTKLHELVLGQRPRSIAEGYAAQQQLANGRDVVGWKIAATSKAGQQHIGVDGPLAGRIFADRLLLPDGQASMRGNAMAAAECEFVFVLGEDIPPRDRPYDRATVMAAVASLHPGLELPDSRYEDFLAAGAAALVADNACAHWMVLGDSCSKPWRDVDLAGHPTRLLINGAVATSGYGRDALGDPRDALCWLANAQVDIGISLRAGQFVTTGVTGAPTPIRAGDEIIADLGEFGQVCVRLTA